VDLPVAGRNKRAHRDIVVIGASAGGVEAIMAVLRQLPGDLKASIFVVCHMLPTAKSHLVDALNTAGPFVAKFADDEEAIAHGIVYVAPPDRHLLVKPGHVRITRGPRENRWRPAIDPLFRSAAVAYGERVIGVVLTGMLDDGTAGLLAIKRCQGVAVVQEPEEAAFPEMPRTALANVTVDHRLLISEMGHVIERLVAESVARSGTVPTDIQTEARIAETGYSDERITDELGELSPLSCPECGGPLWQTPPANSTTSAAASGMPTAHIRCFPPPTKRSKRRCGRLCACSTSARTYSRRWRTATVRRSVSGWCSIMSNSLRKRGIMPKYYDSCSLRK
jgi:two-component system chemotaxis response regulator CheB